MLDYQHQGIERRVILSTILWTTGYVFASGGFLTYFASELGVRGTSMGVFLAVPELVGGLAVLTRLVGYDLGNRKWVFVICSLAARLTSLGIPCCAWISGGLPARWLTLALVGSLALTSVAQAMANVVWMSWIPDVLPRTKWGRLMAIRNISGLVVLLTIPVGVGFLRDSWKTVATHGEITPAALSGLYILWFCVGQILMASSVLPLWGVPSPAGSAEPGERRTLNHFANVLQPGPFRRVVVFQWWHGFFSGLTQAAFFDYRVHVLKIGLGTHSLMEAGMRLLQIPVNQWSVRLIQTRGLRWVVTSGVAIVASSLCFWSMATAETWWWLWGAYLCWGGWGFFNVASPLLTLHHAPSRDNTLEIAVADRGAGMWAGVAGLLGGALLGVWVAQLSPGRLPYLLLFLISCVGRLGSLVWLWRIPKESTTESLE